MRYAHWLDHVPPWASWGALAVSDVFSNWELFFMALPLTGGALVEAAGWQLSRWRKLLEVSCLLVVVVGRFAKLGWVVTVIFLLFALCGARLAMPRGRSARIQIIFMAFLLFLITTIANTSISFLPFTLIWTAIAGTALLQLNWENTACPKSGPMFMPPMGHVAIWTTAAAALGVAIFLIIPRPDIRWRPLPFGTNGLGGNTTGLTDTLSLDSSEPIYGNSEVVARIMPQFKVSPTQRKTLEARMELLTAFHLEYANEGRWEMRRWTPQRNDVKFPDPLTEVADPIEYYVYPSPTGVIPMPLGSLQIMPPTNMRIYLAPAGVIRWAYPLARPMPFKFKLSEPQFQAIQEWQIQRRNLRLPDPATEEALNWSLRIAPRGVPVNELVELLTRDLRTFTYTLDNPSGKAKDPLGDFLNNTRAGHCEYFAHALASALRHRGVASRVVNGYRLGQWIQEGGYWLVTQNEAHSWVEYVDPDTYTWASVDPTPPGAALAYGRWPLAQKLGYMVDAMKFRWDRYVVRFSDEEQQKGVAWAQRQGAKLWNLKPSNRSIYITLVCSAAFFLLAATWKKRDLLKKFFKPPILPGTVLALRPLIKSARTQPSSGETIRAWILRLAAQHPNRRAPLMQLADMIEGKVYGNTDTDIVKPIKQEAKAWQRLRRTKGRNQTGRTRYSERT